MTATLPNPLPNQLLYTDSTRSKPADYLIFFIPGNPGIIQFYALFLKTLHQQITQNLRSSGHANVKVDVLGVTLRGFECDNNSSGKDDHHRTEPLPADISTQLTFLTETLFSTLSATRCPNLKVLLTGHSLGSFLAMELLQRFRPPHPHLQPQLVPNTLYPQSANTTATTTSPLATSRANTEPNIAGAIAIFPALTHLARSRNGKVVAWLAALPGFVVGVVVGLKVLGFVLPRGLWKVGVRWGLGYPGDAAEVVRRWVRSGWGLWESVHLGREELIRIADDRWDDETWASGVHLLVGEKDGWVPEKEWAALLAKRALSKQKATSTSNSAAAAGCRNHGVARPREGLDVQVRMVGGGAPHDFAIRHSVHVAEVAAASVCEIIDLHEG